MSNKNRPYKKRILNSKRGFFKDISGVSEVLGDILLVSMSVVLVAVIAYQVSSIQTPVESTKIDLVASIDQDDLVIKHMGGERLDEAYTEITVGTGSIISNTFNITDGNPGDNYWTLGEVFTVNISSEITTSETTRSQIFVQVRDIRQNTIILDQVLRKGISTEQFPDIGLEKASFIFSDNNPDNDVFINIEIQVVNYGPVNVSNINVRFFDGKTFIGANNSIAKLNYSGLPDDNMTVNLRWRTSYIGKHIISAKAVPKLNETNLANNYLSKDLVVGAGVNPDFIKPNLILKTLIFSKEAPKSKETVIVTAEVGNTAKITSTGFQLRWGDDFEGINSTINITTYSNNVTYVKGAIVKFEWTPQKGGSHKFWARIENVLPSGEDSKADADPDLDRDYLEQIIEVLPTILLVDDDRAGRGSVRDTVTYMRESLNSIGVNPDIVTVSGGDGPQFTGTGVTLDDYDVVIWMSGYETTNTLTTTGPTNDIANLKNYLDTNGSLWVIGQDITNDLWNNGGAAGQAFLSNYLHVSGQTLDQGVTATIRGNDNCDVVVGLDFNTYIPPGQSNKADVLQPNGAISAMDDSADQNLSLLSNATTRGTPNVEYRVAFFGFEFAHIRSSSDRAILTYEVMQWFNATVSLEGDDVAVSEVTITPKNPHFKQEVLIKATIRNNGLNDLTGVKVVFKEVFLGVERIIDSVAVPDPSRAPNPLTDSPDTNNPMSVDMVGRGGLNLTFKYWTPSKIGLHAIKVIVDPNDVIKEFNEENNEFQSILDPTDVFVDAITLVVDDDMQAVGNQNTTNSVVQVLDYLNYKYEVYTVSALTSGNGPGINNLTKYNQIIWVLGNTAIDTLKDEDMTNITSYLTNYDDSKLMIIGQSLTNDANFWGNTTFRQNLLGLSASTSNVGTPSILYGVENNNLTHGVEYTTTNTFPDGADTLSPNTGAEGILYDSINRPFGVAFHNTSGVDYKVLTLSFEYSFIDQDQFKQEFMYSVLHWFGQIDNRIEFRVTWDDLNFGQDNGPSIEFSDQNPVLGDSYILQAKVWNLGGTPGGAVVRFVDGTTVINSVNVYVPASTTDSSGMMVPGTGIAEVIWTPLFAGNRPITVKIDPDQNVPITSNPRDSTGEVFKFNNNASRSVEVYFFFDDMETGAGNWDHDATILNINGEQPIEYFDRLRPVDTNIIDDFDWANSDKWSKYFTDGHSLPSSYMMKEPLNQNLSQSFNLKVTMCIDDSGSMRWNDPTDLRLDAAQNFVKNILRDGDQAAVYQFETYWDPVNDNWVWWGPGRLVVRNLYYYFDSGNTTYFESFPFENTTERYLNSSYEIASDTQAPGNAYFDSRGGTPFYECIRQSVNDLNAWTEPNMYPVVIGLTDGVNNWAPSFTAYLTQARATGVPIYTVGLGGGTRTREMYDIAEASNGGKYYFASSANVLDDVFQRIAADIGGGGSRAMEDTGPSTDSRSEGSSVNTIDETDSRADSRAVRALYMLNPVGGEKWGISQNRNVTWACRADTQANCASATIQISIDGAGWTTTVSNVGTRLDYPAFHQRIWFRNADWNWYPRWDGSGWVEVFNYNWSVPDAASNNVQLRVCITDGAQVCSSSGVFEIFDMGILLGGGNNTAETKYLTTEAFRLTNYQKATLQFQHRYDLLYTENGAVILVGTAVAAGGPYLFEYAEPTQPYTGNIRLDKNEIDDYGNGIRWAWNGRSGGGTFDWEFQQLDLTPYINPARPWVKVQFKFFTWGFGNGGSWWLDDIKVKVQRSDTVAITNSMDDQWEFFEWQNGIDPLALQPHSGTKMWWNHNPANNNDTKSGIDNSLYSKSIDLTNAKDAHLSAYFMFNYDDDAGRPPDGFRTEVSSDNGVSWRPINLGVRTSWGISGDWSTDGKSGDGTKAYTGIQDSGLDSNTPVWVEAGTLWRLNTNLTGWAGSVIKVRFRVVTNLDPSHFESPTTFRGFAVDDVIIRGNTTISSAPLPPDADGSPPDHNGHGYEGDTHVENWFSGKGSTNEMKAEIR